MKFGIEKDQEAGEESPLPMDLLGPGADLGFFRKQLCYCRFPLLAIVTRLQNRPDEARYAAAIARCRIPLRRYLPFTCAHVIERVEKEADESLRDLVALAHGRISFSGCRPDYAVGAAAAQAGAACPRLSLRGRLQYMTYEAMKFNLPELKGLSEKQIKVHLGLYEGYVKHVNLIAEKLAAVRDGKLELDPYLVAELRRRFAFEFDGMRMHEYYFSQFEGEKGGSPDSALAKAAAQKYGSGENFIAHIKEVAGTRGIGWVVVYYDQAGATLHTVFVGDHELGQLAGLPVILALDLWEHAFMVDYVPAEKKNYVDAFFDNLNWGVIEKRFDAAMAAGAA
jgi:Fe-Mn family superoxide dismutase